MFQPTTLLEKRVAVAESLLNQILVARLERLKMPDPVHVAITTLAANHPQKEDLQKAMAFQQQLADEEKKEIGFLLDRWAFMGHSFKDAEAARVLGENPVPESVRATHTWLEPLLRANSGLLECFGDGLHNPNENLVGNNAERYREWLAALEPINGAISDTRASSFLRDSVMGEAEAFGGLPVLLINTGDFLHLIALTQRVNIQTLSIRHLSPDWSWDIDGQWRTEMFSYQHNLPRDQFLHEYLSALVRDGRSTVYVPEDLDADDLQLINELAAALNLTVTPVALVVAENVPDLDDEASNDAVAEQSDATPEPPSAD